jgi:predicted MFS family arabinose efflux permease
VRRSELRNEVSRLPVLDGRGPFFGGRHRTGANGRGSPRSRPSGGLRSWEVLRLRSWRMWAVLTAIALAQAGFLGAYSFVSPLLTDRAGIPDALVPLVLVGFGIGALVSTVVGGRLGDRQPLATIAKAASASAAAMLILSRLPPIRCSRSPS